MTKAQIQNRIKKLAAATETMESSGDIPAGWSLSVALAMLPIVFQGESLQEGIDS